MKLVPLGIFALVINLGNAAHAACMDTRCTEERPVTASQTNDATLGARIDYALKDLEIANARAFKADPERLNALCTTVNCTNPEPTNSTSGRASGQPH
jgi:hypothetical protein